MKRSELEAAVEVFPVGGKPIDGNPPYFIISEYRMKRLQPLLTLARAVLDAPRNGDVADWVTIPDPLEED